MFEDINRELRECKENILLKERLEKKLATLKSDYNSKNEMLTKLKDRLDKEFKDVERLNKLSIANLISTILNNKEEKLEKEEQEYLEAKLKYDEHKITVEALKNDISSITSRINSIDDYKDRYDELINKKAEMLKGMDRDKSEEIKSLEESLNELMREGIEVQEAINECINCEYAVNSALKNLKDASGLATWDMIGGGGFVSMMKHSSVRDAKKSLEQLGYSVNKLDKELRDVDMVSISRGFGNIESSYFIDVFFDNIFTDISVSREIDSSLQKVEELKSNIGRCKDTLYEKESKNKLKIQDIKNRYREVVEDYI